MADVAPGLVFPDRENKSTEEGPAALRGRESSDHHFLPLRRLDLKPFRTPAARGVHAIGALRHDAFQPLSLGFREELPTIRFAVTAERDQLVARQDGFEPFLALEQRLLPQVRTCLEHQIESAIQKLRLMPQRVLEQLKMRDAILSDCDELAVDHGVALDAFERLGDL